VCFRANPSGTTLSDSELNALNERLLKLVNDTGEVFLSHTGLNGKISLRLAIGNIRTTEHHVARAWEILQEQLQVALRMA
jgi:aromatic-L-amino-acid decarboxylase